MRGIMSNAIKFEFEAKCSECGNPVDVRIADDIIFVDPCVKCMALEFDKGKYWGRKGI